jgi:glycosyltransferase involved in cell wall biosynthesis
MKIIFDAEEFKIRPRGVVKTTICLYQACQIAMPDMEFLGITRKPVATVLPEGIKTIRLQPNLPRSAWRFVMYNAYMPFHDCTALHFPANGLIPPIITAPKTNIVMTLHDILPMIMPGHFSSEDKLTNYKKRRQNDIDRSLIVFTVSEHSKKDIVKHFRCRTEPVVLYPAPTLAPEQYDPIIDIKNTEDYFIYTGGYDRRKGLDDLLRVFLGLHREKKITSKLYLTGSKSYYSDTFKKLLDEGVAQDIVKEFDYVDDRNLIEMMRRSRGLIYPSRYEGFGLPPLEAMNVGCPVITTPYSSIPEICGDAPLYIHPDDDKAFGEAIIALDASGPLRARLIAKGKEQADRYSWSKSASIFLEHISRLHAR